MSLLPARPLRGFAVAALCLASACGTARAGSVAQAVPERAVCADLNRTFASLRALGQEIPNQRQTLQRAAILDNASDRMEQRARALGDAGWRVHELALSIRILERTVRGGGDREAAKADIDLARAGLGCITRAPRGY